MSRSVADNRLGKATLDHPQKPVVWLHAASLGELSSVRPFVKHLSERYPDYAILVTTNNPKAQTVGRSWSELDPIFQTAPLDLPFVNRRFLDFWKPQAFINTESEIWPNRFKTLQARSVPAIALNARLSDSSAKRYSILGASAVGFTLFRRFFAQDQQSANNLTTLLKTSDRVETIPNIKALVSLPVATARIADLFAKDSTLLAASTHQGEEEFILDAFSDILSDHNELRLILAPRHPDRVQAVQSLVTERRLSSCLLSQPDAFSQVTIVDTLGELPKLYALSKVTFVGGSLFPNVGGHTPYEPTRGHSAIVTGPFTDNFKREYEDLLFGNACLTTTEQNLSSNLRKAVENAQEMTSRATEILPTPSGENLFERAIHVLGLRK